MRKIGIHMSFPSVQEVIQGMKNWNLNTLQIATRNMRNMKQRATIMFDLQLLSTELAHNGFGPLVIHAPYALNPASPDPGTRERCIKILQDDMDMMPNCMVHYVLHPGSYMWGDPLDGMQRLCEVLRRLRIPRNVYVCVEMMAGSGTQLMSDRRQIEFLQNAKIPNVKMTFDSCHVFAAGMYCTEVLQDFTDSIKVIHLNGSEGSYNSKVDRHAKVARNGLCERIVEMASENVPIVLETPSITMQEDVKWLHKVVQNL